MFIRQLKNRSGSTSVQLISKIKGRYKVEQTIGRTTIQQKLEKLIFLAKQEIERIQRQPSLFISEKDNLVEEIFSTLNNANIQTIGSEIIFGKIYNLTLTRSAQIEWVAAKQELFMKKRRLIILSIN